MVDNYASVIETCEYLFRQIKSGNFDVEVKEHFNWPKNLENEDMQAVLDEDSR